MIWLLVVLLPFLKGFGCGDDRLAIINNYDMDIHVFYSCDRELTNLRLLRSGFWIDPYGDSLYVESSELIRKKSIQKLFMRGSWPGYFRECENEKVYFFVFSDSIVLNYTDHEIQEKELYEKRMEYTLNDLKKSNWIITFP